MIPILLSPPRDRTPGGTANAFLQEDGVYGFLLEDGTSYLLMEA